MGKLEKCAKHYGYQFQPHNALEDAKAIAYCYRALLADTKYVEYNGHIKEHKQNQKNIGLAVLALGVIVFFLNVTTGIILMIIGLLVLETSRWCWLLADYSPSSDCFYVAGGEVAKKESLERSLSGGLRAKV